MSLTINALPLAGLVKNHTQNIHTEVEDLLQPTLSQMQTKEEYVVILKMFYGYFFPVEKAVENCLSAADLPDLTERRKAASILHDLHRIDYSTANLALCSTLPVITNRAQAFGALYVLEGSTMGGKVIAKMLKKKHVVPDDAMQFFNGYGENTGSKWKRFLEVFNEQSDHAAVLASARDTFYCLKGWMQQTL